MGTYTIGREETNDIVIEDSSVSRQHARVEELGPGRYLIVDLKSANGCFVEHNASWQQFSEAEVSANENLLLGDHQTTARDLIRRIAKPRQPGVTVMAEAEETRRGFEVGGPGANESKIAGGKLSWWKPRPEHQKIAAIVAVAVLGLLIVGAATIGLLKGA